MAQLCTASQDFPKADEWYGKAVAAHPNSAKVHRGFAGYLLDRGKLDTARAHAAKWRDAGFGYLVCGWPEAGRAQVEAFARDVMPEFTG